MKTPRRRGAEGRKRTGFSRRLCVSALILCFALNGQTLERAERLWAQHDYQGANDAFRALVDANPKNAEYRVRWGRLFLERFNPGEAAKLFQEALELDKNNTGALLGLALVAADHFEGKAPEFAQNALAIDPKLVPAQELLARVALEDNDPKKAGEEAEKALKISPDALDAMAILATIDWMNDKAETPWIGKILAKNPRYGKAYETAAHFFVINRRYEEGIALYQKAIAIEPDLWSAHSQLGINLMRLGREAEARKHLEAAYENHYRDAATVDTLRLMDSYKNFVTFETSRTILRLHRKEADLLRPYFQSELDRALATYDKKYKMRLPGVVQVEVYPDHEDFAVRTMGTPGLGALGVTFGNILAMDSPSGRKPGSFHWASTLWHELSHVYVLSATKHRVPRWFTEGMAVYEETAISPDWGDRLDPPTLMAIKKKELLPIETLDRGFIHPTYPGQVVVSYFQAGRICGFIAKKWGYDKLLAMMHDFAANVSTPDVVRKELGMEPEDFDKQFLAAIDGETKDMVAHWEDWQKGIKSLNQLVREKKYTDAIAEGKRIRDWYPDYVEHGSAYEALAEAYEKTGDKAAALSQLEAYSRIGGRDPETIKTLASMLADAGRPKDAAAVLDRLNFINPVDDELHRRLGDLWLNNGNVDGAIREYRATLARKPIDPAASHFALAKALRMAKRNDEAKDELLLALEAAPGFKPAQKMLLELSQ